MTFARDYARALLCTPEGRQRVREMCARHNQSDSDPKTRAVAAGLLRDIEEMENGREEESI